jgi:hypothetical protein
MLADGSIFQTDDLVWISSTYKTNGEIVKVSSVSSNDVTIVREATAAARTGLRWNHTTNAPGTEKMTLVHRDSTRLYHSTHGSWSASSSRDFTTERFHDAKTICANGGVIMRCLNKTDSINNQTFETDVIYEL